MPLMVVAVGVLEAGTVSTAAPGGQWHMVKARRGVERKDHIGWVWLGSRRGLK